MRKGDYSHDAQRGKGRPRGFSREKALLRALDVFWRRGYEPASISELCKAMEINAPSLYSAFGNKAKLFLEALNFYENEYWKAPYERFKAEPDVYRAVDVFFRESAHILLSPDSPCGCMLVLAAINISDDAKDIVEAVRELRFTAKKLFTDRLIRGIEDGQLPDGTDVAALAGALNAMLEGLSIQARDGLSPSQLEDMASHAVRLLPNRESRLEIS